MYLEHFNLQEYPFTITPNTQFYCELPGHKNALNTLLYSLRAGEGLIKITGEVGTGKTLLCRMLLNALDAEDIITAYIPNPSLEPLELYKAIASELALEILPDVDQSALLSALYQRLLEYHQQGKRVVVLIDEAQALPTESLEAIRLLTNLETETTKLLQVALFGQPELDSRLRDNQLRQVKQRISFSYKLPVLNQTELSTYLHHRLAVAGYTYGSLFTSQARRLLYRSSQGLPRLINILCHKALLAAYGRGEKQVDKKAVKAAIADTEGVNSITSDWVYNVLMFGAGVALVIIVLTVIGFLR
ncbi:MAG: MSHA fimbrial biogenesis protein MshM [Gammaproteobacteria bacterium]